MSEPPQEKCSDSSHSPADLFPHCLSHTPLVMKQPGKADKKASLSVLRSWNLLEEPSAQPSHPKGRPISTVGISLLWKCLRNDTHGKTTEGSWVPDLLRKCSTHGMSGREEWPCFRKVAVFKPLCSKRWPKHLLGKT